MNVARALGGRVQARNLPAHEGGGALVEVRLPQSAMAI